MENIEKELLVLSATPPFFVNKTTFLSIKKINEGKILTGFLSRIYFYFCSIAKIFFLQIRCYAT